MINKKKKRFQHRLFQAGCIVGAMVMLSFMLLFAPAIAQGNPKLPTSPVILDGRQIFQVSDSGQFTAKERANLINSQLRDAVSSSEPLQVKVEQRNQLPTILLNDRYLLTITESDAPPTSTPEKQAQTWATQIQQAVDRAQQERSHQYIMDAAINSAAVLCAAIVVHWILGWFWQHTLRRGLQLLFFLPNDPSYQNLPKSLNLLLSLILAGLRLGLWLAIFLYLTNLFPLTRQWSYQLTRSLTSTFTSPVISLGDKAYSVTGLMVLVILLWGLIGLASSVTKLLRSRVLEVAGINRAAQEMIAILTKYTLIALGTVVLLQIWGLDLSSLTILASALGVGIGFGFQDIAKNFGSGLVLILERPIQVGDFVEVGEYKGIVERIGGRSTLIKTLDQVAIIVPNSRFLEKELINWNHDNTWAAVRLPVGVSYDSNVDEVRAALIDAAKTHTDVLSMPAPQVLFKGFGDSALNFELRVWTAQPSKQFIIKSDLYYRIEAHFRERGIEIPFPQRDLNLRHGNLPIQVSPQLEAILLQLLGDRLNGKKIESDPFSHDSDGDRNRE